MAKFRWLIQGEDYLITGTNDEAVAIRASEGEVVIDTETGVILQGAEQPAIEVLENQDYLVG